MPFTVLTNIRSELYLIPEIGNDFRLQTTSISSKNLYSTETTEINN